MRKVAGLAAIGLIASSLSLGACNDVTVQQISQVQQIAQAACAFVPTVASVVEIFAAGGTALTAVKAADIICNAIANLKPSAALDAHVSTKVFINGKEVQIQGQFVKNE